MQSLGSPTFISSNNAPVINDTTDVLEIKAIAEYERDRKRAHKGQNHKKVTGVKGHHHHISNNYHNHHNKLPTWKRTGAADERERRALNQFGWDVREGEDQWVEERIGGDAEDFDFDKENKPSSPLAAVLVGLEELVIRPAAAKAGKKLLLSRPGTPRQISRASTPFSSTFPEDILLEPLMDTNGQSDSDDDGSDDGLDFFEFSSPGADDWAVVVTEDGCLKYSTSSGGIVASTSSTTTVIVMPCTW